MTRKILFFVAFIGCIVHLYKLKLCSSEEIHYQNSGKQNAYEARLKQDRPVRIGYFHGGRTVLFYRAYINDYFDTEGAHVNLLTKSLHKNTFHLIPKSIDWIRGKRFYGKVTGMELIEEIMKGTVDGATVGEASFISAVVQGAPIVAVAELGHDVKNSPGHAIVFRKDVVIHNPKDIKGKVLMSRRAGHGDQVFLLEFLRSIGLEQQDVKIIENLPEDELKSQLKNKSIDGGYFHLGTLKNAVRDGQVYVYRELDWLNPELSHALLVFKKDFIRDNSDIVTNVVKGYMKRIKFEYSLSREERLKSGADFQENHLKKALQMSTDFYGMDFPQYDFPPLVSVELLEEMQELLLRYKEIGKKVNVSQSIDNSFVKKVYEEIK